MALFTGSPLVFQLLLLFVFSTGYSFLTVSENSSAQNATKFAPDRLALKAKVKEMFMFAYNNYMEHAFPHDEIMPVACKPRIRGVTPSRGDVDDAMGNFSLTLVDALDTLVVIGELDEFEAAVRKIIETVRFDSDLVVSVFETNIRMVGGLLSGHTMAKMLQSTHDRMSWYNDELLWMCADLADRLLPAFNTTSGLPHPRVNLKRGMPKYLKDQVDTCTACSGTMILEMAALSRLTGRKIYEETARKAMDFLWTQRNHGSDLVGTVLNVENGNWVRRESGIGAGVDSYLEYALKGYILLGDEDYLYRFNKHYEAVKKYVSKGPMFVDVHMHKPTVAARPYMDALLAFWPGLQVLKGDLRGAIEIHEMLYHVVQKFKFLPEAFTHDFQIHWAQHPLRPEFIESTYILYRATKDVHYLHVAEQVLNSIEKYTRVPCGYSGIKDLRTMEHEDRLDSFVLSETFKYLYLIFAEPNELPLDPDNYVLTTEAHFLPLTIGDAVDSTHLPRRIMLDPDEVIGEESIKRFTSACPNVASQFRTTDELTTFGSNIRSGVKKLLHHVLDGKLSDDAETCQKASERLRAWAFSPTNADHLLELKAMGIDVEVDADGRFTLIQHSNAALTLKLEKIGLEFMKEMIELNKQAEEQLYNTPKIDRTVQILSWPFFGSIALPASPAQFGLDLNTSAALGRLAFAAPVQACEPLTNAERVIGRIAIVQRGGCMFQEKARFAQQAGAVGVIVVDNQPDSSFDLSPVFSMSGDNAIEDDVRIPVVLLFRREAHRLLHQHYRKAVLVRLAGHTVNPHIVFLAFLKGDPVLRDPVPEAQANAMIAIDGAKRILRIDFRFGHVSAASEAKAKQIAVEENIELLTGHISFLEAADLPKFQGLVRLIAYTALGYDAPMDPENRTLLRSLVDRITVRSAPEISEMLSTRLMFLKSLGTTSAICKLSPPPSSSSISQEDEMCGTL